MSEVKYGIAGTGQLGKLHLKNLMDIPGVSLAGIYDSDSDKMNQISGRYSVKSFPSLEELLDNVDALSIVTPTSTHFDIAIKALAKDKHLFIEKPVTATLNEVEKLIAEAEKADSIIQVGHIERFNPAFRALEEHSLKPKFIEAHRLASFDPRGTDVAVVLDLMIHDIDLALNLVKSKVKRIDASGVCVISNHPDIANARIQFQNGAVANLTASRISQKKMRKMRLFQQNAYITMDFLEKSAEIYKLVDEDIASGFDITTLELEGVKKKITYQKPPVIHDNALLNELQSFVNSIINGKEPAVTLNEAAQALSVAIQITDQVESNTGEMRG